MPLLGSPHHAWGQGDLQYMNMLHKWRNKETRKKGGRREKEKDEREKAKKARNSVGPWWASRTSHISQIYYTQEQSWPTGKVTRTWCILTKSIKSEKTTLLFTVFLCPLICFSSGWAEIRMDRYQQLHQNSTFFSRGGGESKYLLTVLYNLHHEIGWSFCQQMKIKYRVLEMQQGSMMTLIFSLSYIAIVMWIFRKSQHVVRLWILSLKLSTMFSMKMENLSTFRAKSTS